MEIRESLIRFNSREPWYSKEKLGFKTNTCRRIGDCFERERVISSLFLLEEIEIIELATNQSFRRLLTDISFYDDRFIFSWEHPGGVGSVP